MATTYLAAFFGSLLAIMLSAWAGHMYASAKATAKIRLAYQQGRKEMRDELLRSTYPIHNRCEHFRAVRMITEGRN